MTTTELSGIGTVNEGEPEPARALADETTGMVARLADAIAHDRLDVVLERTIALRTATVSAVEAQARWWDGSLGFVEPAQFVALAERNNLIKPLGACLRRRATHEMRHWHQEHLVLSGATLWLKVSPLELDSTDLAAELRSLESHEPWASFGISVAGNNARLNDARRNTLLMLTRLGYPLSLPNLGATAYALLAEHPRSTLRVPAPTPYQAELIELLGGIVADAHRMGFSVTATGVESDAQYEMARQLGCGHAHGFLTQNPEAVPERSAA